MLLRPCLDCPHKKTDCSIKDHLQKTLKAALRARDLPKLTVVHFQCKQRLSTLPPGTRVDIDDAYLLFGDFTGHASGTIIGQNKHGRALVWLDEKTYKGHYIVGLHPNRLFPSNEPPQEICPECRKPKTGYVPTPKDKGFYRAYLCTTCHGADVVKQREEAAKLEYRKRFCGER